MSDETNPPPLDWRAKGWVIAGCVLIGICLLLMLVGCDETPTPREDLSDDSVTLDTTGWTVYANFDEFPNVAVKCDGTARMYATTRIELPLIVIPDHPSCQGGQS